MGGAHPDRVIASMTSEVMGEIDTPREGAIGVDEFVR
jgi:hypothetical protein